MCQHLRDSMLAESRRKLIERQSLSVNKGPALEARARQRAIFGHFPRTMCDADMSPKGPGISFRLINMKMSGLTVRSTLVIDGCDEDEVFFDMRVSVGT